VHSLFAQQLKAAKDGAGVVDVARLRELVSAAYEGWDQERERTDRSIAQMIEELDQLHRSLEQAVAERTTTLKSREAELRVQNARFDAAINTMTQALMMYDAQGRLAICNDRYYEMYRLARGSANRGATVLDVLQARADAGMLNGEPEALAGEILEAVAGGQTRGWLVDLPDGRTISVLVHPTADGGWVSTHEDITQRRDSERRLAYMARHDALTGLPNRMHLHERLADELTRIHPGERLAVLCLDIDKFKAVNDMLGHATADEYLKAFAERLRRAVDPHDFVARIGADQFAIVQTGSMRSAADTAAFATRLCEIGRLPQWLDEQTVVVDVSIGIAFAPGDGLNAETLIKNAGIALDRAKENGRGAFRFFEPEMDARMRARRMMEAGLRLALAQGEFHLHYQPVIDLRSGLVTCCEALLRWNWPGQGEVQPGEFVPIAEDLGLIVPIGEWVLRQACQDAKTWPSDVRVAINLSPIQLQSPQLVPIVINALAAAGLDASRLEIEITESVLMQNTEMTLTALHRLHTLGIRISMDDFGTGYSSLSNLRSFPFDKIKIDRSFIAGLPDGEDSIAIVRAVASLAKSLGMITTAEGVETVAQMEQVRALGVTEMQGFHFSRPRPIEHINRLLSPEILPVAKYA
jgi:diguanylate cyclase (GGDEF)-like protein